MAKSEQVDTDKLRELGARIRALGNLIAGYNSEVGPTDPEMWYHIGNIIDEFGVEIQSQSSVCDKIKAT